MRSLKVLSVAAFFLSAALSGAVGDDAFRQKVIFDTDMFTDIDELMIRRPLK